MVANIFYRITLLIALSFTSLSANAATIPGVTPSTAHLGSETTGSSLILSAWDDATGTGYSIDLGVTLNDMIGADPYVSGGAGISTNTMVSSGTSYSGPNLAFVLPDWNLTSGLWNMAAVDTVGRNRLLVTNSSSWTGATNSDIKLAGAGLNNYLNLGAALSTSAGTLSATATSDAWYPNTASWGDNFGGTGITGTAFDLTGTANLFVAYQKSITSGNGGLAGGYAALTTLTGGQSITAYLTNVGGTECLIIGGLDTTTCPIPLAIPEPNTNVMLLIGASVMGFMARRRKQIAA